MRKDKKGIIASSREIFALRAEKTADCASRREIIAIRREIIASRRGIIAIRPGIIANRREIVASNRDIFASRPNVKGDYPQLVAGWRWCRWWRAVSATGASTASSATSSTPRTARGTAACRSPSSWPCANTTVTSTTLVLALIVQVRPCAGVSISEEDLAGFSSIATGGEVGA